MGRSAAYLVSLSDGFSLSYFLLFCLTACQRDGVHVCVFYFSFLCASPIISLSFDLRQSEGQIRVCCVCV